MNEELTEKVIKILKERQGSQSLRQFAAELGISASFLSDIYRGHRKPGEKVIQALGLKFTISRNLRRAAHD